MILYLRDAAAPRKPPASVAAVHEFLAGALLADAAVHETRLRRASALVVCGSRTLWGPCASRPISFMTPQCLLQDHRLRSQLRIPLRP